MVLGTMRVLSSYTDPTFSARKRSTGEILRRVGRYLLKYPWLTLGTMASAILGQVFALAFPKLTQHIIDEVIAKNRIDQMWPFIGWIAGAFLLSAVFNSLRIRINNHLEQNVVFDLRRDVYAKLQRLPVSYFDQRSSGDLMTRVIEDVNNVERVLIDGTEQGVVALLSILGAFGFMVALHPPLAFMALVPMPFLVAGALWYTMTAHSRYRALREASSAMNALLFDNLQGNRQIKAFGRESHEDQRFAERAEGMRAGSLKVMTAWATYSPAMDMLGFLGTVCVLGYGGAQVIQGQLAIGELVGFLLYLNFFYEPIRRLHGLNQLMQGARAAGERVFDILDRESERADAKETVPLPPAPVQGRVVFDQVSFSYENGKEILKNIDLEAPPGTTVALVGPTGAGKSTIVNLIPAFYEVSSGRILIDGIDIRTIPLTELRQLISVVSQEPFLFNGTVRENILYGKIEATEAELLDAAEAANCMEFIAKFPDGMETRVGERGVKLSVGQKQRISIARALIKDAPILILDEATSSVDTATERLIQEALDRLMRGRTSFVIAHRLSTIEKAHQILVIQNGHILEKGRHHELLAQDGLYARLTRIQNTRTLEELAFSLD
ncbi:MAG: ABC transporter ATP-binding protein/permease [Verrucomicrobia bacterium]|nr:ABC transporter ATP-binding protein/permease [Verrucomicrobiota bacterium]